MCEKNNHPGSNSFPLSLSQVSPQIQTPSQLMHHIYAQLNTGLSVDSCCSFYSSTLALLAPVVYCRAFGLLSPTWSCSAIIAVVLFSLTSTTTEAIPTSPTITRSLFRGGGDESNSELQQHQQHDIDININHNNTSLLSSSFQQATAKDEREGNKIVGGTLVGAVEHDEHYPWVVAIVEEYKPGWFYQFCGGSLIDSRFLVTAAHCVTHAEGLKIYAVVGRHNLSDSSKGEIIPISQSYMHPDYNPGDVLSTGDIAIMRLDHPVSASVRTIPLIDPALSTQVLPGTIGLILGWGRLYYGDAGPLTDSTIQASGSEILHKVQVPIVSNDLCNADYEISTNNFDVLPTQICAGSDEGGHASCQGDSGGPLITTIDGTNCLIGVVSWAQGCASPHFPTVLTRISSYLDFIVTHTTLVETSLHQGEGAEDALVFAGLVGNYIFSGQERPSTMNIKFENLSPQTFVMALTLLADAKGLVGSFDFDQTSFRLPQKGSSHIVPMTYSANESIVEMATLQIGLVTAITTSEESYATLRSYSLPPADFDQGRHGRHWYTSKGAAAWTVNKKDVFTSGATDNLQGSCLLKYFDGPGELTFEWQVSSEETYDGLFLFIDNQAIGQLSGLKEWEKKEVDMLGEGEHTVTFCFFKDRSVSRGTDRGEVMALHFVPISTTAVEEPPLPMSKPSLPTSPPAASISLSVITSPSLHQSTDKQVGREDKQVKVQMSKSIEKKDPDGGKEESREEQRKGSSKLRGG